MAQQSAGCTCLACKVKAMAWGGDGEGNYKSLITAILSDLRVCVWLQREEGTGAGTGAERRGSGGLRVSEEGVHEGV